MGTPFDSCDNVRTFKGKQPAGEYLPPGFRRYVERKLIPGYTRLLETRLPSDLVEHTREMVVAKGVVDGRIAWNQPFYISDEDIRINGAIGNSSAFVIPGRKGAPVRVVFTHTDIPGLRAIAPWCVMDAETCDYSNNFYFATQAVGGIRPEDWYGQKVVVRGYVYQNGERKLIEIPGLIEQHSVHTDEKDSRRTVRDLRVITPYKTLKQMHKQLGLRDSMDFGRSALYVFLADSKPLLVDSRLAASGQDNRSCHYAAHVSGLEALASGNTTFVFSLDQEEVGSIGNSGAWEGFVRYVMEETLRGREGKDYARLGFPNSLNTHLLGGMPALSADVDVAFSAAELEENDEDRINFRTAAVAGWGFFICADNTPFTRATSPLHVDKLMTLLDKKLPGQRRRSRYQVTWSPHSQDSPDQSASMSEVFDGKMPILDVGIPLISTHHPGSESINIWDLAWLKEMLTLYMIH